MDRGITPHIPVWDKSGETKGKYTKAAFTYDRERNLYICPGAKSNGTDRSGIQNVRNYYERTSQSR